MMTFCGELICQVRKTVNPSGWKGFAHVVIFTEQVKDKVLMCFPKSAYRYIPVYMRVVLEEGAT